MELITFLSRILVGACILLVVGQLFGVCVFPETAGYRSRMVCVEGEWKRKISLLSRGFDQKAQSEVQDTIQYSPEDRERLINF